MALPGALGDDRQVMAAPAHAVQALEVHFAMPTPSTLERFIARVESNAHAEAIAEFYAEHGQMRENQAAPRVGRDHLVAHGALRTGSGATEVTPGRAVEATTGPRGRRRLRDTRVLLVFWSSP